MAANVTTTLADALKVFYISGKNEQLNKKSVLYKQFAKKAQLDVEGKSYTYHLHVGRNKNAGLGMAEGGGFGAGGNQSHKAITVPTRYLSSAIEITGPAVRAAKSNLGAFVNAVTDEVDGVMDDSIRSLNRQLNGDGTGALAYWTAADDTVASVNVDDSQGNAFIHMDAGEAYVCDIIDASDYATILNTTASVTLTVGAENATTWTVTGSGTVSGTADGDFAIFDGTLGQELLGLDAIISASDPNLPTGGLQGLAVATYGYWKAQSFKNSGTLRDLSLALMQKPLTRIETNTAFSESDIKFLLCNGPVKDKYIDLLLADKRHVNTMELDGGQTSVAYNTKALIVDPQCKRNTIWYPNPNCIDLLTSSGGFAWADFEDGEQFKMKVGSSGHSDAYMAYLVFYGQFATKARNGSAVLGDLIEA